GRVAGAGRRDRGRDGPFGRVIQDVGSALRTGRGRRSGPDAPDAPGVPGGAGSVSRGSTIVSRVIPGRLVTSTAPSCAATTASTIASPSPVEVASVTCERDASARV